jgi:exoribonuclease II
MAKFSWRDATDLMARLEKAQNRYACVDIMTFAGFCESREELERHVARYEQMTGLAGRPE